MPKANIFAVGGPPKTGCVSSMGRRSFQYCTPENARIEHTASTGTVVNICISHAFHFLTSVYIYIYIAALATDLQEKQTCRDPDHAQTEGFLKKGEAGCLVAVSTNTCPTQVNP